MSSSPHWNPSRTLHDTRLPGLCLLGLSVCLGLIVALIVLFRSYGLVSNEATRPAASDSRRFDVTASSAWDDKLQLPDDFTLELVADNALVPNVFRMALSPEGEIFASGPGYIRRLADRQADGRFERTVDFAQTPQSGAQGLYCGKDFVLAVGDGGLWRFDDRNSDGVSDGAPQQLIKIATGGEHLAHQIRLGPDGWWYLLAGNQTPISPQFSAGDFSPVRMPRAGFLMRLSPDFASSEVLAHGLRNAYDFAFNDRDEIFVYDSDDEREAGLPWYRPTRLFQLLPGDDAGWFNDGWKRPSYFFDMPIEVAATGRGSPTGVICYSGLQFPADYQGAIFFADWTFGRIWVVKRDPATLTYLPPSRFATTSGQSGFAVTDLLVDRDGSLLVSVGGRGTAGAIYRIRYQGRAAKAVRASASAMSPVQKLARKRTAWDDRDWETVLTALNDLGPERPGTESAQSAPSALELKSSDSNSMASNKFDQRLAIAAMLGRVRELNSDPNLRRSLAKGLESVLMRLSISFDPVTLKLLYRLGLELDRDILEQIDRSQLGFASRILMSMLLDDTGSQGLELNREIILLLASSNPSAASPSATEMLAGVRLGQLAIGDCGDCDGDIALQSVTLNVPFDLDHDQNRQLADQVAQVLTFASAEHNANLTIELARLAAMMGLRSAKLHQALLGQIGPTTGAIEDLHWLYCLSRAGSLNEPELSRAGSILVALPSKFQSQQIRTDRNWQNRVQSLYQNLVANTPGLADPMLASFAGEDRQIFWLDCLPPAQRAEALSRLVERITQSPGSASPEQLRAVIASRELEHQELFRQTVEQSSLQELSIIALTRLPVEKDRPHYRQGLSSRNLSLVKSSAVALRKLSAQAQPEDLIYAYRAMTRLSWTDSHVSVRDQLVLLIQDATRLGFDYQPKQPQIDQSAAVARIGETLRQLYPDEYSKLMPVRANWLKTFEQVDWNRGNADRGGELFRELKCAQCHQGNSALGPSLEGVAKRFSREDRFRMIGEPAIRVSDRYRAKLVITTGGETVFGLPVYESVDGITLQDTSGQTIRLEQSEIEEVRDSDQSLMPNGLLDELRPDQFADLDAYLRLQ